MKSLLKTKKLIKSNLDRLWNIAYNTTGGTNYSAELQRIFTETMKKTNPNFKLENIENKEPNNLLEVPFDPCFDFVKIKAKCDALETFDQKRKLIKDRVIDFQQWQYLYDEVGNPIQTFIIRTS